MTTWLIDTTVLRMLASPNAAALRQWCEAENASLFLSAASLTEIAAAIGKMPASRLQRANALREWLNAITSAFADRIHPIDTEISVCAGANLPRLANSVPRHRLHDAQLVATAQVRGHGLLTRREGVFGPWAKVPIATV